MPKSAARKRPSELSEQTKTMSTRDVVKQLETKAFKLASRLHSEVGLSGDLQNELKRLLKRSGRARSGKDKTHLRRTESTLKKFVFKLEAQLQKAQLEIPEEVRWIPGGAGPSERRSRRAQADELQGEKLSRFHEKVRVCMQMEQGATARQALERLGVEGCPRWARKVHQLYREQGIEALHDGRATNGTNEEVM